MKIVIVGGGTAGWITAAMFKKYTTFDDIIVVDSSKIPIIGAGEGSTGSLPWFITDRWPDGSVNEIDFLRKTKGTLKLGITLKNWKGDGGQIYSPFHGSPTDSQFVDTAFFGSILKYGRSDYASLHSWMLDEGLTTFRKEGTRIVQGLANHSYHFDGVEVGKFFKEWCTKRGVKCVDSEIDDVTFDEKENLESVKLSNGDKLKAALWFDCSGFSRVLMGKTKNKWISYDNHLPTNTALPFSTNISSKTVKFETEATALNSGWMWKIPLQHRHGCGYVFCDAFQSVDDSIKELEIKLGHKVEPIKTIKFEAGRYENIWYNNIVSVGLSSHFLEPLQATSIHISITSLFNLIFHYLKGETYTHADIKGFNNLMNTIIDDYKDFIQMHYLTDRQDTPFWKFITNELTISDKNKNLIDISNHRSITMADIEQTRGSAGYSLWSHILQNSNLYKKDIIEKELIHYKKTNNALDEIMKLKMNYNKLKNDFVTAEEFFKYLKL
jgi:hypothetical protein